jgi:hypothetical protein
MYTITLTYRVRSPHGITGPELTRQVTAHRLGTTTAQQYAVAEVVADLGRYGDTRRVVIPVRCTVSS